jgi:hemoglobin
MPESLYQRLGGAERIAAIIEESLDRHAVNPVLAARLRGKDLPELKQIALQFFCAGAEELPGKPDLAMAQAGVDISGHELLAAMDDIVAALGAQDVRPSESIEVLAMLFSLRDRFLRP